MSVLFACAPWLKFVSEFEVNIYVNARNVFVNVSVTNKPRSTKVTVALVFVAPEIVFRVITSTSLRTKKYFLVLI